MSWWKFWDKKTDVATVRFLLSQTQGNFTQFNFAEFVKEGYQKNPTVYACIQEYVKALNSCPIVITKKNGDVIQNQSLMKLINKPNPTQSWSEFLEQVVIYYLVGGEAPIWGDSVLPSRLPAEIWILRPDWLTANQPRVSFGAVEQWTYNASDSTAQSMTILPSSIMMFKATNPLCRYRGQSPLAPCAYAIDQLNAYAHSNKKLLDNDMQPAGALSTELNVEDSSFNRLKEQFTESYAGVDNQRKPLILEGGLKWQPFSFTMRDAEFLGGKQSAKSDICEALDVPSQLLGLEGSQTHANYEQARASFYEDSAIPFYNNFLSQLNKWLGWRAGLSPDDIIKVDIDAVAALEPRRADRNKVIDGLQCITANEKRASMGYEAKNGGDELLVNSGLIPIEMAGADVPSLMPPTGKA